MSPPYSEGSSVQPVHSVLHAVRVLEFFASHPEEHLSLTDVSRGLQMHKTTVYRILRTLQSVGWVEQSQAAENTAWGPAPWCWPPPLPAATASGT